MKGFSFITGFILTTNIPGTRLIQAGRNGRHGHRNSLCILIILLKKSAVTTRRGHLMNGGL